MSWRKKIAPLKDKQKQISLSVSDLPELQAWLKKESKLAKRPVSKIIRAILLDAFERERK